MKRWGETTKTLGKAKSFAEVSDSVRRCTGDESAGAGQHMWLGFTCWYGVASATMAGHLCQRGLYVLYT